MMRFIKQFKQKSAQSQMIWLMIIAATTLLFMYGLISLSNLAKDEACRELGYYTHFNKDGSHWCQSLNHAVRVKMECKSPNPFKVTCTAESKELVYCIKPNWTRTEK